MIMIADKCSLLLLLLLLYSNTSTVVIAMDSCQVIFRYERLFFTVILENILNIFNILAYTYTMRLRDSCAPQCSKKARQNKICLFNLCFSKVLAKRKIED